MKKTIKLLVIIAAVSAVSVRYAAAQTAGDTVLASNVFDTSGFPLWAKDLRRGEIVAFGSFPFAMFATTFFMDTRRWIDNNGMDWSETGRRYAPWPLKSAGAIEMTNREHETTLIIAASLSAAIALTDFIIVQIKRHQAQRRAENLPAGNIIINQKPLTETTEEGGDADSDDADSQNLEPSVP
jgi:hypothetical protein